MEEEKRKIFREASLKRVSSPEQLDEYIKVITPGIWLALACVICLLLGFLAWAVFGTLPVEEADGVIRIVHPISYLLN